MASIDIHVKDVVTGKVVEMELPDDVPMRDLLPEVTNKLGIRDAGGHKLSNKTKGFEYNEEDTLASKGTEKGDKCELAYEPEWGN